MSNKYTLNTDLRLEPILLSLSDENYKQLAEQVISGLYEFDRDTADKLKKYVWLAESQLQNHVPTRETLKKEFPELIFDDYLPMQNQDELTDYIYMFITQKKQRSVSSKLSQVADNIRSQGINEKTLEEIYKYTSLAETEGSYEPITRSFTELYQKKVKMQGLSFLCPELNKLTGGLQPGQVCTVLGASGSMKTTYSANIAYNALKEGKNVLYLSLEEAPMQLYSKLLSRASIDVGKALSKSEIELKKLEEKDQKILLDEVVPYFENLPGNLYIVGEIDLPNYALTSLEAKFKEVDKLAKKETEHGIDLLVVDHIQLLKFAQQGMSEFSVINMYVSFFRQQSLSWLHEKREISIILLSQANREGLAYAQKHDGQYLMQHVAEASEIERASAYIISVYTDAMIQITKYLKLGAVKLRGSQLPTGTINVYADGEFYQVGDQEIPEQSEYSSNMLFSTEQSTSEPSVSTNQDYTLDDMMHSGMLDGIEGL